MAKSTVAVRFTGDVSNLERSLGAADSKLGRFGSGLAKFGAVAASGMAAAGVGAVALGSEVLNTGAKLTAWRNKAKTVFEDQEADVKKWADANNEIFGLTDDELTGLAASFGDLLKPMGFTAEQAADMSKDVVGLSGALSEWTGGTRSAAEVSEILSKAMLGEREGLKELGISITEADVSARLAAKGQDELTGAALEQAKAVATQELIFEKSTDAQKAFAEGGNEALRAQNKLKAGLDELREQVADRLLPVVTKIVDWAGDNLPQAMAGAERVFNNIRPVIEQVGGVIESLVGHFRSAETGVGDSSSKIGQIVERLKGMFQSYFDAITAIVTWAVDFITAIWEGFGSNLIRYAEETFDNILKFVGGAFEALQGIFEVFAGIFTGDWGRVWDGVKMIFSGVWNALQGILRQAMNLIRLAFEAAWATLKTVITGAWGVVGEIVRNAWGRAKDAMVAKVTEILTYVWNLPAKIRGAMGSLGSVLWDAGKALISGLLNGIKEGVKAVIGYVGGIAGDIASHKGPISYDKKVLIPNGLALMDGLAAGIKRGMSSVDSLVGGIAPSIALDMPGGRRAAGIAAAAGSSGAGVTVNVNISGSVYGDRRALMGEISQAVRDGIPLPR